MSEKRNPSWTRDELILALDLYFQRRRKLPNKNSSELIELSAFLNIIGQNVEGKASSYRNLNSVYMKLNNFRAIDPSYTKLGKTGLSRGGKEDLAIWQEFSSSPEKLAAVAASIRAELPEISLSAPADFFEENFVEAPEGRILSRVHLIRERNKKIVDQKKKRVLVEKGVLECEACNFNFRDKYGKRGDGFIEAHHTKPLHQLKPGQKTSISDLTLLCSNCHRMIHAKRPWFSIIELQDAIKASSFSSKMK